MSPKFHLTLVFLIYILNCYFFHCRTSGYINLVSSKRQRRNARKWVLVIMEYDAIENLFYFEFAGLLLMFNYWLFFLFLSDCNSDCSPCLPNTTWPAVRFWMQTKTHKWGRWVGLFWFLYFLVTSSFSVWLFPNDGFDLCAIVLVGF